MKNNHYLFIIVLLSLFYILTSSTVKCVEQINNSNLSPLGFWACAVMHNGKVTESAGFLDISDKKIDKYSKSGILIETLWYKITKNENNTPVLIEIKTGKSLYHIKKIVNDVMFLYDVNNNVEIFCLASSLISMKLILSESPSIDAIYGFWKSVEISGANNQNFVIMISNNHVILNKITFPTTITSSNFKYLITLKDSNIANKAFPISMRWQPSGEIEGRLGDGSIVQFNKIDIERKFQNWLNSTGLTINQVDAENNTLLHLALKERTDTPELLEWLMEKGEKIDSRINNREMTILAATILYNNNINNLIWIENYIKNLDIELNTNDSCFKMASLGDDDDECLARFKWMKSKGADFTKFNPSVVLFSFKKDTKIFDWLLQNGMNFTQKITTYGDTALHMAVEADNLDAVQWLVKHNADINAKKFDETPLDIAVKKKYTNIAKYLRSVR